MRERHLPPFYLFRFFYLGHQDVGVVHNGRRRVWVRYELHKFDVIGRVDLVKVENEGKRFVSRKTLTPAVLKSGGRGL